MLFAIVIHVHPMSFILTFFNIDFFLHSSYYFFLSQGCYGFQYPENGPACIIVNMDATIMLRQLDNSPAIIPVR